MSVADDLAKLQRLIDAKPTSPTRIRWEANGALARIEVEINEMQSLVADIADWLELVINDWNYYVGGNLPPDLFLVRAEKMGWKRPERDQFGDRIV